MSAFQDAELPGSTTIADAATASGDFSVLAAAVRAAQLVDTLASPGPFTVFAPTDAAFSKLPAGEMDRLLEPENRVRLTSFVASHILAGKLTMAELHQRVHASDGHLTLRTVDGDLLRIEQRGSSLFVVGATGARAMVTNTDMLHSNGVIHMTDSVLFAPAC